MSSEFLLPSLSRNLFSAGSFGYRENVELGFSRRRLRLKLEGLSGPINDTVCPDADGRHATGRHWASFLLGDLRKFPTHSGRHAIVSDSPA